MIDEIRPHAPSLDGSGAQRQSPLILIVAGEASGDRHGARLIEEIRRRRPKVRFVGIGGDRMREQGVDVLYHASQMSVVGFVEVLKRYVFFRRVLRRIIDMARARRPDLAILVDYPGFNLRLAKQLRALGIPVVYYIAPQVWAWKEGRVEALRKYVTDLIVVFPFEVEYFRRHGIDAHFFGHPLIDQLQLRSAAVQDVGTRDKATIAYLPGSRPEEIRRHMPLVRGVIDIFGAGYRHVIPLAPTVSREAIEMYAGDVEFTIVSDVESALSSADVAMVKSGTSTVETAVMGVPFVVFYRTSALSYQIARRFIKVGTIAMVNLLAGRAIVREYIQHAARADRLAGELRRLLEDEEYRGNQQRDLQRVVRLLGETGAAARAAEFIVQQHIRID